MSIRRDEAEVIQHNLRYLDGMIQHGIERKEMSRIEIHQTSTEDLRKYLTGWVASSGLCEDSWKIVGILADRQLASPLCPPTPRQEIIGQILDEILDEVDLLFEELGISNPRNEED